MDLINSCQFLINNTPVIPRSCIDGSVLISNTKDDCSFLNNIVHYNHNGQIIFAINSHGVLFLIHTETSEVLNILSLNSIKNMILDIPLGYDFSSLIMNNDTDFSNSDINPPNTITQCIFSNGSRFIVTVSLTVLTLWDMKRRKSIWIRHCLYPISTLSLCFQDHFVVWSDVKNNIYFISMKGGQPTIVSCTHPTVSDPSNLSILKLLDVDQYLLCVYSTGHIGVYECVIEAEVVSFVFLHIFSLNTNIVNCVAFNSDKSFCYIVTDHSILSVYFSSSIVENSTLDYLNTNNLVNNSLIFNLNSELSSTSVVSLSLSNSPESIDIYQDSILLLTTSTNTLAFNIPLLFDRVLPPISSLSIPTTVSNHLSSQVYDAYSSVKSHSTFISDLVDSKKSSTTGIPLSTHDSNTIMWNFSIPHQHSFQQYTNLKSRSKTFTDTKDVSFCQTVVCRKPSGNDENLFTCSQMTHSVYLDALHTLIKSYTLIKNYYDAVCTENKRLEDDRKIIQEKIEKEKADKFRIEREKEERIVNEYKKTNHPTASSVSLDLYSHSNKKTSIPSSQTNPEAYVSIDLVEALLASQLTSQLSLIEERMCVSVINAVSDKIETHLKDGLSQISNTIQGIEKRLNEKIHISTIEHIDKLTANIIQFQHDTSVKLQLEMIKGFHEQKSHIDSLYKIQHERWNEIMTALSMIRQANDLWRF